MVLMFKHCLTYSPRCRTKKTLGQDYHLNCTKPNNFSISAGLSIFLQGKHSGSVVEIFTSQIMSYKTLQKQNKENTGPELPSICVLP